MGAALKASRIVRASYVKGNENDAAVGLAINPVLSKGDLEISRRKEDRSLLQISFVWRAPSQAAKFS
jgi:hypothetical protein